MNLLMLELGTLLLFSDSAGVVGTAKRWHGSASAAGVNAANVRLDILSRSLADPQLPDAVIDANAPQRLLLADAAHRSASALGLNEMPMEFVMVWQRLPKSLQMASARTRSAT